MKTAMISRVACAGVLSLALSGVIGATAASASSPKLVVTPSTNLHNGEKVKVSGSGFKPGDSVVIVECLAKATGESNCKVDIADLDTATINKSGDLPATAFKVSTGKIGNGSCGTKTANLKKCAVSVGNTSGGDSAVKIIGFKAPKK